MAANSVFRPRIQDRVETSACAGGMRRVIVRRVGKVVAGLAGVALWLSANPSFAQSNLDAGKSASQIFSHTCNACHRSPREIKKTTVGFMREHYTTGIQEAQTMTAYLASIGTDPKAVEQRRKPTLGAGTAPVEAAHTDQAKPDDAQAKGTQSARTRRPSESLEIGQTVVATAPAAPPAAATVSSPPVTPVTALAPAPATALEE